MIDCPAIQKSVIRTHYDVCTPFYRLLWGQHIHHGYWFDDESPSVAQLQLTRRLAEVAGIHRGATVYDIGCGMGGSSRWLARELFCKVTGITLSPVQRFWAASSTYFNSQTIRPKFLCADAETVILPPESADVVWSIECTEHLFDKPAFFKRAASWLRPAGRFALCAWLSGEEPLSEVQRGQVIRVCEGMFCPSLASQTDYTRWFEAAGMRIVECGIWTKQVQRTWEICLHRIHQSRVRWLAKVLGKNHVLFLDRFEAILDAYRTGAMEYGYFVAEKIK